MNVIFAGKGQALVAIILSALPKIPVKNLFVLPVENDKGQDDWQVSVYKLAQFKKLNIISLDRAKLLDDAVFISVQYDKILRPEEFKSEKIYNIHFSFLPFYKGVYPAIWPILNQEDFSGVTLHCIDNGIDTGNIIDQEKVFITDVTTSFTLYQQCCEEAVRIFAKNFAIIISTKYNAGQKQPSLKGSYYSKKSLDLKTYRIDLRKTACEVSAQLRSMMFKPYQMPKINDVEINDVEIIEDRNYKMTGKIIDENDDHFLISTIDYLIKAKKDYSATLFGLLNESKIEEALDLIKKNDLVNATNEKGWTPLCIAVYTGNYNLCKKLLECGADVNSSNFKGTNILMYAKSYASKTGDLEIVRFLIENGADINHRDNYDNDILHYARVENNSEVIQYFKKLF